MTSCEIKIITSSNSGLLGSNQSKSPTYVNSAPKNCYSEGTSSRFTEYGPGDYGSTAFGKCKVKIKILATKVF